MAEINERIAKYLKFKDISNKELANKIGVTPQAVSLWKTVGSVGIEPIIKILGYFTELNARWLILGSGIMEQVETEKTSNYLLNEPKASYSINDLQLKYTNALERENKLLHEQLELLKQKTN